MTNETFNNIWKTIIKPTYNRLQNTHGNLHLPDCEADVIKTHYLDAINYAKEHYMMDENGVLNRHKVAAAMMIAVLKAKPIKKTDPIFYQTDENGKLPIWTFNEHLAITVALSMLCTFIDARVDFAFSGKLVSRAIFEDVCLEDKVIFKNGVPISKKERNAWERELYQIRQDGAYNLLSFAHIISGIEERGRMKYFLDNPNVKPTYPKPDWLTDEPVKMLTVDDIL